MKSPLLVAIELLEIESISAIEAMSYGAAPLISNHKMCTTKDFSLDDHPLFKHGSSKELAKKIEWFYEQQDEFALLRERYIEHSKEYALKDEVDALEQMFVDAVNDMKEKKDFHSIHLKPKDKIYLKLIHHKAKKQAKYSER